MYEKITDYCDEGRFGHAWWCFIFTRARGSSHSQCVNCSKSDVDGLFQVLWVCALVGPGQMKHVFESDACGMKPWPDISRSVYLLWTHDDAVALCVMKYYNITARDHVYIINTKININIKINIYITCVYICICIYYFIIHYSNNILILFNNY